MKKNYLFLLSHKKYQSFLSSQFKLNISEQNQPKIPEIDIANSSFQIESILILILLTKEPETNSPQPTKA